MKSLPKTKITRNTGPHAPKNELKIKKLLTLLGKGKSLEGLLPCGSYAKHRA